MASLNYDLSISNGTITRNYTYKDVKVDVADKPNNRDIEDNLDYQAIEGGIFNLFLFNQGERIINPEFGNSLYKYLYEPISELTARKIGEEINLMFTRWEPRVKIEAINIEQDPDQNQYNVEVQYTVPSLQGGSIKTFNTAVNARR